MKRASTIVAAVLAAVVASFVGRHVADRFLAGGEGDVRSRAYLSKLADELNKSMPLSVDSETQVVSTLGLDGIFVYK